MNLSPLKLIKIMCRCLQRLLERWLIGSCLQNLLWRTRHLYRRDMIKCYQDGVDHYHRVQIAQSILSFSPLNSVCEIGCATGANLIRLRRYLPEVRLIGFDINSKFIAAANDYFTNIRDQNFCFMVGKIGYLDVPNASFDVVLSDAVLMFIAPNHILTVISEMCCIAKKGLVLNEYNLPGAISGKFDGGRWVYDIVALLRKRVPSADIRTEKSSFKGGAWDTYGTLIMVRF